jgi:hypothetical protein
VDFVVSFDRSEDASLDSFLVLREGLAETLGRPVDLAVAGTAEGTPPTTVRNDRSEACRRLSDAPSRQGAAAERQRAGRRLACEIVP